MKTAVIVAATANLALLDMVTMYYIIISTLLSCCHSKAFNRCCHSNLLLSCYLAVTGKAFNRCCHSNLLLSCYLAVTARLSIVAVTNTCCCLVILLSQHQNSYDICAPACLPAAVSFTLARGAFALDSSLGSSFTLDSTPERTQ